MRSVIRKELKVIGAITTREKIKFMHYTLEIIMPPTENVEEALKTILEPFSEHQEDSKYSFWDWYVVGGRFAGQKLLASFDKTKIDLFYEWCKSDGVTVAGLQCGKQELQPSSQIPKVDAKWNELFPENEGKACPLFSHSNNQYDSKDVIQGDICSVKDIPKDFTAERFIIAAQGYNHETKEYNGELEAVFMLSADFYNGVNFVSSDWKGNVLQGLKMAKKKNKNCSELYRKATTPKEDWLSITVDYHT